MALLSDQEYYYKLDNIILISLEYLRQVFKNRWKVETEGDDWIEDEEHLIKFVEGVGQNAYKRAQSFQKTCLKSTFVAEWDMSLLSVAIQNFGCEKKYEKENVAVRQLKNIRNDLAHNGKNLVTREDYLKNVDKIRSSLQSLGMDDKNIDKIIEKAGVTSSLKALEYMNNLHEEAKQFLKDGQTENAADCLSEAVKVPSLLPVNLGTAYEKRAEYFLSQVKDPLIDQDKCNEALLDVTKAIELHEYSWIAHHLAAQCYRWKSELSQAIIHYEKALAISPAQEKVKADYDSCKALAGVHNRKDHLNPPMMPMTLEELMLDMENKIGVKMSKEDYIQSKIQEGKYIKGQDHLYRGLQCFRGWNVTQNFTEAVKYFSKAAKVGNAEGMYNLARCYHYGHGVSQDVKEALRIYRQVAEMDKSTPGDMTTLKCNEGVASAQHAMGLLYQEGVAVERDYVEAASWYKKAMENGLGNAANNLGLLYSEGQGMPQDEKMAELCWKEAVNLNSINAAASLMGYYKNQMEPDKATDMLRIGREMGNSDLLKIPDDEFNRHMTQIKSNRLRMEPEVVQFEKASNLDTKGLTFKERLTRKTRLLQPGLEKVYKILDQGAAKYKGEEATWGGQAYELTMETIFNIFGKAEQGSSTASRIKETWTSSAELYEHLENYTADESENITAIKIVNLLYNCITLEFHLLSVADKKLMQKLKSIVANLFDEKCDEKGEDDMKIRLCYAVYNLSGSMKSEDTYALEVLKEGVRRYPDNVHYYTYLANTFANKEKYKDARLYAEKGLQLFPNDIDLLYCFASLLWQQSFPTSTTTTFEDCIVAFKQFIEVAPSDDRKVPEAYYQISSLLMLEYSRDNSLLTSQAKEEMLEQIKTYFTLGQESEKNQLPCYLPYGETEHKCTVENFLKLSQQLPKTIPNVESERKRGVLERKAYLLSPARKSIILRHRQELKQADDELKRRKSGLELTFQTSNPPKLKQTVAKRMSQVKSITLQEMNPTEDQIYDNRMLDLTIMDELNSIYASVNVIAEDENGDLTRLYLYNVDKDKETLEKFQPGCAIAIINPYMRIGAVDATHGIRNDEPMCVVFMDKVESMCRFCGEGNASRKCSKCKRPYCSEECQRLDWKKLNHKLICPLKF